MKIDANDPLVQAAVYFDRLPDAVYGNNLELVINSLSELRKAMYHSLSEDKQKQFMEYCNKIELITNTLNNDK